MKKYLSNSKDNKQQKTNNKLNKPLFDNNLNFNYNYNNSSHFSPINKINKDEKNYYNNYFYSNVLNNKNKSNKNIIGNNNKINIDINFNNNINYIYIFKKNSIKNKSNNHLFTMK